MKRCFGQLPPPQASMSPSLSMPAQNAICMLEFQFYHNDAFSNPQSGTTSNIKGIISDTI